MSQIKLTTLSNGLRVASDKMADVESVSLGVWIGKGTRHEPEGYNGLAHFLEHMAFKGTKRRSSVEISREIENVGGHINAYTSREQTCYYAQILANDAYLAVDILADILQNSTFDEKEIKCECDVIGQEIAQSQDTPDDYIFDCFYEKFYPNHPLGKPILGKKSDIEKITSDILHEYIKTAYLPSTMVVTAAGNIDHDKLVGWVEQLFHYPLSIIKPEQKPALYKGGEVKIQRDLEQVQFVLGFQGLDFYHKDYYALQILVTLLGGGMSSRLFQQIREKRGLVYSIYSFSHSFSDNGMIGIYAGTGQSQVQEMASVLTDELLRLPHDLVEEEIVRAKNQLIASLKMSKESSRRRCEQLANHILIYGQSISLTQMIKNFNDVSLNQLQQVASNFIKTPATLAYLGQKDPGNSLNILYQKFGLNQN
ncbi:MAG: insulinase family protein [Alphaproteobacteria bacterium]|nr:insulinase family protein [Alphaproteobacteria bacterium]